MLKQVFAHYEKWEDFQNAKNEIRNEAYGITVEKTWNPPF